MKLAFGVILKPNERELIEALESDVPCVDFAFRKKGNVYRSARGTRNLKYVPINHWPKSPIEEEIKTDVSYFDFEKQGWRAFRLGSVALPC